MYGLDLLKSLLTPTQGFEMADDGNFKEYKTANDDDSSELTTIMKLGKACWSWIAEHKEVVKREWCEEMLTDELLDELDQIFVSNFGDKQDYLFVRENVWLEAMQSYGVEVEEVFSRYIGEKTWEEPRQQTVRTTLPRKLQWMLMEHKMHYATAMPFMTVSTIQGLVESLDRVSLAIREVSVILFR